MKLEVLSIISYNREGITFHAYGRCIEGWGLYDYIGEYFCDFWFRFGKKCDVWLPNMYMRDKMAKMHHDCLNLHFVFKGLLTVQVHTLF